MTEKQLSVLCNKIAKLTDYNQHTDAKLIVCKELKYTELAEMLVEIDRLHQLNGHLTNDLSCMRSKIHQMMMAKIKSEYTEEIYLRIKSSF